MPTAKEKRDARAREIAETNKQAILHPDQVADVHGDVALPTGSSAKVIVACKLGIAYFDIQHCKLVEVDEQTQTGIRRVKQPQRMGSVVRLRGTAYPRGTPPEGFPPPPEIVAGAALNYGIDKEWFDEWLDQNKLNPVVVNKMIFAHEKYDAIRGAARDMAAVQSGLEPLNPKKDPRVREYAKSNNPGVSDIEMEEGRAKKQRQQPEAA